MTRPKLSFVPDGPLLNNVLEERRVITELLEEADQKCREAAELRACAIEFESDAATLREDVARRQARMVSLKIRQEPVIVKKDQGSRAGRKGKKKHVMKTAAGQKKITGARPERMNARKKRHEHDVDPNNDPISGAPIAPSTEKTAVWLPTRSYGTRRDSGAAYSKAYVLLPGELPMMCGGVLTTIDHPNFDASQLLHIETQVHLRSQEEHAAESCQFITADED